MRQLFAMAVTILAAGIVSPAVQAEKVEVTGVHLCCGSCKKAASAALSKVEGVSDIAFPAKTEVSFTATDAKTAKKGYHALLHAGFFGKATCDGKALTAKFDGSKETANQVTVTQVHVCCGACKKALQKLFPGATVTYEGNGPQKDVTIAGENLQPAAVLTTLRKAGFNGQVK